MSKSSKTVPSNVAIVSRSRTSIRSTNLGDRPRVARTQQDGEIAFPPLLDRLRDLLGHQVVVDRLLDVAEDADRRDADLLQHHTAEREGEAGLGGVLVVNEQRVLADLGDVDELD